MARRIAEPVCAILIIVVTLFNMVFLAFDSFKHDMEDLPEGNFVASYMSPDTKNTLKIYEVNIKDVGTGLRGELNYLNESGQIETRNIYWETKIDRNVPIGWINKSTLAINEHIIDINGEPFDSRSQIELPEASAKNRNQTQF